MARRKGIPAQNIRQYTFKQMDAAIFKPGEPLHDCLVLHLTQQGLLSLMNSAALQAITTTTLSPNPSEYIEVRIYGKIVG